MDLRRQIHAAAAHSLAMTFFMSDEQRNAYLSAQLFASDIFANVDGRTGAVSILKRRRPGKSVAAAFTIAPTGAVGTA